LIEVKTYTPFPRQNEFHGNPAKYRLFGGAAGPGKTKALLWEGVMQALETPGADVLLLRRTFPELEMSLLKEWRQDVPWRDMGVKYNESSHIANFPNKSILRFGYCQNENDVYQYQGAEFLFIGIDELTLFTLKMWQFLTTRNRCPIPRTHPCMAGATNPGNIGHAWVKALWIDKRAPAGFERPELYQPNDYAFIKATLADNPIYANDAEYRRTLESLPTHLRQAFLHGDWNVFAGQYFDIFSVSRHTTRAETVKPQPWWPKWVSVDWGFEHPSAVHWHTTAQNGQVITYREFVQNKLTPRMLGQAIAERCVDSNGQPEKILAIYLSPDAFAQRTSEETIAIQLNSVLVPELGVECSPADNDRVGGWQLLYGLLQSDLWLISDSCTQLIETLPILTRDPKKLEDCLKMDSDDACDSARYGLKSHMPVGTIPVAVRIEQKLAEVASEDLSMRAIQYQVIAAQERKHGHPIYFTGRRRQQWH